MSQRRTLSTEDIAKVEKYHKNWRRRNLPSAQLRLAIFRLSCCCGLRCKEIAGLDLGDFFFKSSTPFIRIRKDITKGHKSRRTGETVRRPRMVSLGICQKTYDDLKAWYDFRMQQSGGDIKAPFICGQNEKPQGARPANLGKRLDRPCIAALWKTALKCLGYERSDTPPIHSGRHTCLTLLCKGYSLPYVRDFAGHANVTMTSRYLHADKEEKGKESPFHGTPQGSDEREQKIQDLLTLLCLESGELSEGQAAKVTGLDRFSLRKYQKDLIVEYMSTLPTSVQASAG